MQQSHGLTRLLTNAMHPPPTQNWPTLQRGFSATAELLVHYRFISRQFITAVFICACVCVCVFHFLLLLCVCVLVCFLVTDVRAASVAFLFLPYCLYCVCTVSVFDKWNQSTISQCSAAGARPTTWKTDKTMDWRQYGVVWLHYTLPSENLSNWQMTEQNCSRSLGDLDGSRGVVSSEQDEYCALK